MSRIDLNVVATGNFGQLEGQLARLKAQVAGLNAAMSSGMMVNPAAISGMQNYANLMADNLRSTGMFQTKMVSLTSETERFGQSLQRGNIRLGDYFRTATGHIRNQQTEIQRLAREQVRLMNSTSLAMGDGRAMVITPTGIDEAIHKQQILNQEYRIFRQVVQGGSTQLINWGKNTQWAGRQLTVGLTVPLTLFGAAASQTFMEADKQLTRLAKVYGDASKGMVDPAELQQIRGQTLGLAKEIAASMGVAAEETLGIAADIAATGKEGNELLAATNEAMRLSVLGEVDRQEAMRATLSIQSVFKKDTEGLTESINFLNAVENQTSTSLNDLVTGIVKAGPVVQGLGGDIEDLALMMVAMREGGVPASEAANAIKSSLASLINPTKQTTSVLNAFGVDLISIVDKNAGDVIGTLIDLQNALAGLDELSRQRAIEQIFGKFQFSRINALLNNLGKAGSQTQQVLELAGLSTQELAANADRELSAVADSVTGRFQRALESLKANLIPIGEVFTKVGTMLLEVGGKILEIFNNLPEPVKNFIQGLMFITGLAGPIIMITGVFGNFLGYLLKGVSSLMAIKKAGRGVFEYFTPESVAAKNASELITKAFYDEEQAIQILNRALEQLNKTLVEMQANSSAAVGSMQNLAAGTMAAAEAGVIESSYYRRTGSGDRAGMAGGVFSHRSSKKAMSEVEAGLVAGTGSLLPADLIRATTINTIIKEDVVPIIAEGANQASIELVEGLRNKLNAGLRGGLRPDEERRVFQTKEAYLGETTGQVAYPAIMATAAAQGVAEKDILYAQSQFATDLVESGIESAMSNLKTSMTNMGVDLGLEVDKIHTELADIFERTMRDTGGDVIASMEEVRKAAQGMESKAKKVLADSGIEMNFATGADVKSGQGMSKKVSTASQLAMGEYFGLKPEVISGMDDIARARLEAMKLATEADRKIAETSNLLQRKTQEELVQKNKSIKNMQVRDAYVVGEGRQARTYALIGKKWYAVTDNRVRLLDSSNKKEAELILMLSERNKAESDKARSSRMAAQADLEEAKGSKAAAQADLEEAKGSRVAAQADLSEAGASRGGLMGRMRGLGRTGGMAALGSLSMATMLLPAGEEGSAMATATDILGGAGMGASLGMMAGPWGALAGAIIGGAIPAVTAFQGAQQEANDALVKYGEAINGSSIVLDGFAKEMGTLKPSEKLAAAIGQIATPEKVVAEGQQLLQGESGQKLLEMAQKLGGEELVRTLSTQLKQLTLLEIFTPEQAKIVAQTLAIELGNPMLGQALVDGIDSVLDSEGKVLSDSISTMFIDTIGDIEIPKYSAEAFARKYVENMGLGDALRDGFLEDRFLDDIATSVGRLFGMDTFTGNELQKGLELYARESVPSIVSQLDKLREAQALVLQDFMSGAMSYDEYISSMSGMRDQTKLAADALLDLKEKGAPVTDLILDIAKAGGREEEFKAIEDRAKDIMGILSLGDETTSRFYTQVQIAAAYGDITEGEMSTILQMIQDPSKKASLDAIFNVQGAEDNAVEIIKLLNMGMDADFVKNIAINYVEIGQPLDDIYASLVAIAQLPPEIQKEIQTRITGNPLELRNFVGDYEYAMSLPDDKKEIKAEIFNNEELELFKDRWKELVGLPAEEIKNAVFQYLVTGSYDFGPRSNGYTATGLTGDLEMPGVSGLVSAATQSGGGGGSDNSSVADAFDKRIKAQDKIIEGIKKEREERQKLLNLEKQAFDFAMQEQDLKNQIARARAEGRTAEAAMLQAKLDNARATDKQDEQERIRQEAEDRKIRQAERTKKQLERAKSRATESGGSGGGGGGLSDEEIKRIEQRATYLESQLQGALEEFSIDIENSILEKGLRGFFDSEPIVKFREEMVKLGVPIEQVNEYLDTVFDGFIEDTNLISTKEFKNVQGGLEDLGFEGENLKDVLGTTFGILQDNELTKTEKIDLIAQAFYDAGMDADEAKTAAKNFYDEIGKRANVTSNIDKISSAWKRAGDSAKRTALLQALANDVAQGNLSADVVAGRLASIDIIAPPMALGGPVVGPGTSTSDSIPVRLSNGEYVIRANMVDKYGVPFFDALNKGMLPMMASGGMVSRYPSIAAGMAGGGYVRTGYNMGGLVSGKESEYNINVYVTESNASADDIANKVMQSLQRRDKMNRAGIRI